LAPSLGVTFTEKKESIMNLKRWSDLQTVVFEQRIILAMLLIVGGSVMIWDRYLIKSLEIKLREKEYILAPGVVDFARVKAQLIPKVYVEEFAKTLAKTLGSFSARDIESQYRDLEKYLAVDFRIKFREETKKTLKEISTNDVSELFSPNGIEVIEKNDVFIATVKGTLIRFVSGLKVFEGAHVMEFSLKGVSPHESSPWALIVTEMKRLPEEFYKKQQIGKTYEN
jgi:hypothetical protein